MQGLEEQLAAARNRALRTVVDLQNVRRRTGQDAKKMHKFVPEKFTGDLLAMIDTLEHGLEVSDPSDEAIKPIREGVEPILKMFGDTLRRCQMEALNPEGEPLNPGQHQAIAMQEDASAEPGNVLRVSQEDYLLSGRLLRPAMTVVSKASAEAPPSIGK